MEHDVDGNCEARDVACGVKSHGPATIVEDSRFVRIPDAFVIEETSQDQSGIQFYYPAEGGEARRNVCVGFNLGIFVKARPRLYILEHNTVIAPHVVEGRPLPGYIGVGATTWTAESVIRGNIVVGYTSPLYSPEADVNFGVVGDNVIWDQQGASTYEPLVKLLVERGMGTNLIADPLLIAPRQEDYRLSPHSPAASLAAGAQPAVPADYQDTVAPELAVLPPKALQGIAYHGSSKGLVTLRGKWVYSLADWQARFGKDLHSIYAYPEYVDPYRGDFRLQPGSPNIDAGESGTNIGALGVATSAE